MFRAALLTVFLVFAPQVCFGEPKTPETSQAKVPFFPKSQIETAGAVGKERFVRYWAAGSISELKTFFDEESTPNWKPEQDWEDNKRKFLLVGEPKPGSAKAFEVALRKVEASVTKVVVTVFDHR